jgi:hypothetical protein
VLSRPARILSAFAPTRLAAASRDEPAAAAASAPEAAGRAIGAIGGGTAPARQQLMRAPLRAPHEVSARMRVGDAEPSTPESEAVRLHALSLHRSGRAGASWSAAVVWWSLGGRAGRRAGGATVRQRRGRFDSQQDRVFEIRFLYLFIFN